MPHSLYPSMLVSTILLLGLPAGLLATSCARSSQAQPEVALLLAGLSNNGGDSGDFSRSVEVWPPSSDLTLPDIPLARFVGGAEILDAKVFLCGGLDVLDDNVTNALDSCSVLEDGNWKVGPSLAQKRAYFSLNTVGDTLVAAGGYNDMGDGIVSVELYREEKGAWEVAPWQLTSGRAGHCAATLNRTHLILYGGYGPNGHGTKAEMYNVQTGVVVLLPMIPGVEWGMACTVQDGSLIVSGGGSDEFQASVNRLDLTTLRWVSLPSLNIARGQHTMGVVNGALVVFGGLGSESDLVPADSLEFLNGAGWEKQQLQTSRAAHAMAITSMQFPSPPSPSGSWGLHQWSLQATALVVFFSMIITNY